MSICLFNTLNITVLLHDSDVYILKCMGFKLYEIDDKKQEFIKYNYEHRGISCQN